MQLQTYHNDRKIRIDYNPVLNTVIVPRNAVGPTTSTTLRTLPITPSDTNSVFVSKTGSDTTGDGSQLTPYLTIDTALDDVSASKQYIVLLDSGTFTIKSQTLPSNCAGILSALGQTPVVVPELVALSGNYHVDTKVSPAAMSVSAMYNADNMYEIAVLTNGNLLCVYLLSGGLTACFTILDRDGNVIVAETAITTNCYYRKPVCVALKNGTFVVQWNDGSFNGYFNVYDNDGTLSSSHSSLSTAGNNLIGEFGGYTDRFVIVYTNTNTVFQVYDTSGNQIVSETTLFSGASTDDGEIKPRAAGGFYCVNHNKVVSGSGIYYRWGVVNSSGAVLHTGLIGSVSVVATGCSIAESSDAIIIAYGMQSDYVLYCDKYNISSFALISTTAVSTETTSPSLININILPDYNFVLTYQGSSLYKTKVLSAEYFTIVHSGTVASGTLSLLSQYTSYNERLYIVYQVATTLYYSIKGCFLSDWLYFDSSIEFNGITFNIDSDRIYRYIYAESLAEVLSCKWCNFEGITRNSYADDSAYDLWVLISNAANNIFENSKIFNSDAGCRFVSDNVSVSWSQFYHNIVNAAVYVDGAGEGIIINHNDFLFCRVAVDLDNNDGTEIIKNNNFYQSLLYSIRAEIEVTYSHCLNTSAVSNAVAGTLAVLAYAHYCNDGYITYSKLNLNLKSRVLGYNLDSPGLQLADDGENSGALMIDTGGTTYTWDSITIKKIGVKREYDPVGAVKTRYKNGEVGTYRDAYTEIITLSSDDIEIDDFLNLLDVYFCATPDVRIYLDPDTYPATYGAYKHVFEKVQASHEYPQMSDVGVQDFEIVFERQYNEGS